MSAPDDLIRDALEFEPVEVQRDRLEAALRLAMERLDAVREARLLDMGLDAEDVEAARAETHAAIAAKLRGEA